VWDLVGSCEVGLDAQSLQGFIFLEQMAVPLQRAKKWHGHGVFRQDYNLLSTGNSLRQNS
jgi:hypothetical protein